MEKGYPIPIKNLKDAGVEVKKGAEVTLQLRGNKVVNAVIAEVGKDHAIVTPKK